MAAVTDIFDLTETGTEPAKSEPLEENPFEESEQDKKKRGARALLGNADADPEAAGKSFQLAKKYKVDPALVDVDYPSWESDLKIGENINIVNSNKAVRDYINSDPMAARVSHDDLGTLDKITKGIANAWAWAGDNLNPISTAKAEGAEPTFGPASPPLKPSLPDSHDVDWSSAAHYGMIATRLGLLGAKLQGASPEEEAVLRPQIQALQKELMNRPESNGVVNYLKNLIGGFAGQMWEGKEHLATQATAGSVMMGTFGAIGGPVGAGTGMGIGFAAGLAQGFATLSAQTSAGNVYLAIEEIEGLSKTQKQVIAGGAGLAVGVLEAAGGALVQDLTMQIVKNVTANEIGKAGIKQLLGEFAKDTALGGGINAMQTVAEQLGEQIAKVAGTRDLKTILNDNGERMKFAGEVAQSFIDGLVLTSILSGPSAALHARGSRTGDQIAATRAQGNQQRLDDLMTNAQASLTKERSPEQFENVLARQSPDPVLFLDPSIVVQFKDKFGFIPNLEVQIANAQHLGTEIQINQSKLVAHLDPTLYPQIRDGIRFGSSELNPAEALKVQQAEVARQQKEMEKAAAIKAANEPEVLTGEQYIREAGPSGIDTEAVATDVTTRVQTALQEGRKVTYWLGDKEIPITSIKEGMMADAQGQRWGVIPLLAAEKGKRTEVVIEPKPIPPKENIPDRDLIREIFGIDSKEVEPAVKQAVTDATEQLNIPPAAAEKAQSLIDRFLGRRQLPTAEQFDVWVQRENLKNLLMIKRKPLQEAQVSPTPEALSVDAKKISEDTSGRPQTQDASTIQPSPKADSEVNLTVEIGKAESKTLIDHLRTLMDSELPDNIEEAILGRALSRSPGNKAELHNFIDEEAKITNITDSKAIEAIKAQADAALAALGTRLIKENTAAVVNGLSDKDAQLAARATARALDESRYVMAFTPLFENGEGMTPAGRAAYEQHIQDVQAAMSEAVFEAAREVTEMKETKRWADQKAKMRPEAEEAVANTPVIIADEYFRTGRSRALGDEVTDLQMTRRDVDSIFTAEELEAMGIKTKYLSKSVLMQGMRWAKEDSPNVGSSDMFAEAFGYSTGTDMILDLMRYRADLKKNKETHEQHFNRLVEEELNQRMMDEHGNLQTIIDNQVIGAAWNIAQERVLKNELDSLSTMTGSDLIQLPDMKKIVDSSMREMTNAQATDTKTFQQNAGRHGRLSKEAKDAGDLLTALNEKRLQMQSAMMAKWGQEHKREVLLSQRLVNKVTNIARAKDFDPDTNTRMLQLIAMSGLNPGARGLRVLEKDIASLKEPDLGKWIQDRNELNNADTIPTPTYLGQKVERLDDLSKMNVGNFKEFNDTLRAMEFVGKNEKLVGEKGQQLELDQVLDTVKAQVADLAEARGYEKYGDPIQPERGIAAKWRGSIANLLRVETVTMKIDRLDPDGIMNRVLIKPLKLAQKWKNEVTADVAKYLKTVDHGEWAGVKGARVDTLKRTVPNDSIIAPNGKPREFRRDEMLMVALNWGNAHNQDMMANSLNSDKTTIGSWLAKNMTKENWDFVQNIWDMYEKKLNPIRDGVYQRTRGFGMEYPEPVGFIDAHGVNRKGGYFPILKLREEGIEGLKSSEVGGLIDNRVFDPLPANSHRQTAKEQREGKNILLTLNFDELPNRIKEDIHELTHREAVQNAAKIINDKNFYDTVFKAFGKGQADLFKPWLAGMASDGGRADLVQANAFRWWMGKLQSNTISNVIGFNPGTMLVHSPTAMMNTIGEAGLDTFKAIRLAVGDSQLMDAWGTISRSKSNWDQMTGFALENSAELSTRMKDKKRDIAYSLGQWSNWESFQHNSEYAGQLQIAYTDYMTATVAWWAGYLKGEREGMSHTDAALYGDKLVRLAHNSSNLMDKSQFNIDKSLRPFAQFYGFFNHVVNQLHVKGFKVAEDVRDVKQAFADRAAKETMQTFSEMGKSMGGAGFTAFSAGVFYVGALAFIHSLIRGEPHKDDPWGVTAVKELAGLGTTFVPFVKEASYALLHGEYARASIPLTAALDVPRRWMRDVKKYATKIDASKMETWIPPLQTSFELLGVFAGVKLTSKQMGRWAEEAQRIQRGEVPPPRNFTEWRRLIVYGRSTPIGSRRSTSGTRPLTADEMRYR